MEVPERHFPGAQPPRARFASGGLRALLGRGYAAPQLNQRPLHRVPAAAPGLVPVAVVEFQGEPVEIRFHPPQIVQGYLAQRLGKILQFRLAKRW